MGSSQDPHTNKEYTKIITDQLRISYYPINNPLYSAAYYYIGLTDFINKSLQLTTHNLNTSSNDELLPIPVFIIILTLIFNYLF